MSTYHFREAAFQCWDVEWTVNAQRRLEMVSDAGRIKLLKKPDTFLRKSERNLFAARLCADSRNSRDRGFPSSIFKTTGQFCQDRLFKELAQRQKNIMRLAYARDYLSGKQ